MQLNRAIRWGLSAVCLVMGAALIGCSSAGQSAGLMSEHPLVRKAAVERLGKSANVKSLDVLVSVLQNDPDRLVRSQAAFAIGSINRKHFSVGFDPLAEAVETDQSVFVRAAAATALSYAPDSRAVAVLVNALDDRARGEMRVNLKGRTILYRACPADAARASLEKIVGLKYASTAPTADEQRGEIAAQWVKWYASVEDKLPGGGAVATK